MKTIFRTLLAIAMLAAGASAQCVWQNYYLVGSPCYANIQAALDAAGSTGWVMIPKTYAGTDSYVSGSLKNVVDLRGPFFGVYQWIAPSRPITGYPLGNDMVIEADGPADLIFNHDELGKFATTTTTAITAGVAQNITVPGTGAGNATLVSPNAAVEVARWTADEDFCTVNAAAVNATTLNVTCTKAHTGTTTVEQMGNTVFQGGYSWYLNPSCPASITAFHCPQRVGSSFANIMTIPVAPSDPFPYGALQLSATITGMTSGLAPTGPADVKIRNSSSSTATRIQQSNGVDAFVVFDSFVASVLDILPSTSGLANLGSSSKSWGVVYVGNSGTGNTEITSDAVSGTQVMEMPDGRSYTVLSGFVTTTAAASDAFTLQGVTSSSKCVAFPANAGAATNIASSYIDTYALNSFVMHHAAVANMVYAVQCTPR